jgi:hypothetical protein
MPVAPPVRGDGSPPATPWFHHIQHRRKTEGGCSQTRGDSGCDLDRSFRQLKFFGRQEILSRTPNSEDIDGLIANQKDQPIHMPAAGLEQWLAEIEAEIIRFGREGTGSGVFRN